MWRTYLIVEGFKLIAGRHFDYQGSVVDGDKPNQAEGAPQRAERGGGCCDGQGPTGAQRREFPALMPFVRLGLVGGSAEKRIKSFPRMGLWAPLNILPLL